MPDSIITNKNIIRSVYKTTKAGDLRLQDVKEKINVASFFDSIYLLPLLVQLIRIQRNVQAGTSNTAWRST